MNFKQIATSFLLISIAFFSCKSKEFTKLKSGVSYLLVKDNKGDKLAKEGSIIKMHIITKVHDSTIFSSYMQNNNMPVETMIMKPQFNGDPMEAFMFMSEGDSAVIRCLADSLFRPQLPPFAKSGDTVAFYVNMISVKTKAEYEKEALAKSQEQIAIDDKLIQDYIKQHNLTAQKTASGLYYVITQPGSGENAKAGQDVKMNYTGTLLDGTKFDSNEDPAFGHTEPFSFKLGTGKVIKGWDEGIALLNKGAKATFIIPSPLAYSNHSMPGNPNNPKGIPANSVLTFNVQLLDVK